MSKFKSLYESWAVLARQWDDAGEDDYSICVSADPVTAYAIRDDFYENFGRHEKINDPAYGFVPGQIMSATLPYAPHIRVHLVINKMTWGHISVSRVLPYTTYT
jgi:hypothetical protein